MSTPQNELHNLSYQIQQLVLMFQTENNDETGEKENSIFDNVKQLYTTVHLLDKRIDMLQDQMALIIKLLSKKNARE